MPPALRPPQLPPRSPRYPLKVEEEELEAPNSPPLPNDAVPKDGDDFVSGPTDDFDDVNLSQRDKQSLETPSLGGNSSNGSSSSGGYGSHYYPQAHHQQQGSSSSKMNLFRRGNSKVASTDVASVGNASDTCIPQETGTLTGRALHEHAKMALNQEDYSTALQSFEALLEAQIERFGPCHASVAAAMHNVGGTCTRIHRQSILP